MSGMTDMTIEEFLAQASLVMHPLKPVDVTLGDVLDLLRRAGDGTIEVDCPYCDREFEVDL